MQFLLNNSITIIFLIAAAVIGRSEYKQFLERRNLTNEDFLVLLKTKLNELSGKLLTKLITSLVVAFIISMISFRELWLNDVFHVVFLTMLMARPINSQLKKIFE